VQDPFSTAALEEALEVDGAREILESFLQDTAGVVDRIADSIAKRKQESLRAESHMLRGCCRVLGAGDAEVISKNLETSATSGDWGTAEQQLPLLRQAYDSIAECARRYLNGAA
jgi:HPt (histidine-containing phosphotransfer) domain-containing protein